MSGSQFLHIGLLYLILLFALGVIVGVGRLFCVFGRKTPLSTQLIFVLLLPTAGFAVWAARGQTTQLPVFLVLLSTACLKLPQSAVKIEKRALYSVFSFWLVGVFVLVATLLPDAWAVEKIAIPTADDYFYAQVAKGLRLTGQENFYGINSLFNPDYRGAAPYHYTELWIVAFLSWLTNLSELLVWQYIVQPLFVTLLIVKIIELSQINLKNSYRLLPYFALLFGFTFYTSPLDSLPFLSETVAYHQFSAIIFQPLTHKLLLVYLLGLSVIQAYQSKNVLLAGKITFILCLSYFIFIPPIFTGLAAIYAYQFYRKEKKTIPWTLLFVFISIIFLFVFYSIFSNTTIKTIGFEDGYSIKHINLFNLLKDWTGWLLRTFLQIVVSFSPILFLLHLNRKELFFHQSNKIIPYLFFGIFYIFSITFTRLATKTILDSWQFFTLPFVFLANLFILISLNKVIKQENRTSIFFLYGFSLWIIFYKIDHSINKNDEKVSISYLQEVHKWIKPNENGAVILDAKQYQTVYDRAPHLNFPSRYVGLLEGCPTLFNLSVFSANIDTLSEYGSEEIKMRQASPFYRFFISLNLSPTQENLDKAAELFVEKYGLKFVFVSGQIKNPPAWVYAKAKVIKRNPDTGEIFVRF